MHANDDVDVSPLLDPIRGDRTVPAHCVGGRSNGTGRSIIVSVAPDVGYRVATCPCAREHADGMPGRYVWLGTLRLKKLHQLYHPGQVLANLLHFSPGLR